MPPEGSTSHPITAVKALIAFICLSVQKVVALDGDKDGKVTLLEVFSLITTLGIKVPALCTSIPMVLPQLHDISDEEMLELRDYFVEQFDLPSDRAEVFVEKCIQVLHDNYLHYQDLRAILHD